MIVIKSESINNIKNKNLPSAYFDIKLSSWAKELEPTRSEISCELPEFYEYKAYKHFLQECCECETIKFTTPLKKLFVGQCIEIILPEFGVPTYHGNTLFVITRVEFVYRQNYAVCDVEAKRWNY